MPRKLRQSKTRHDPLAPELVHTLLTGQLPDFSLPAWAGALRFPSLQVLHPSRVRCRQHWQRHGPALLDEWIAARPGSRPWAWWEVAAPRWQPADQPASVRQITWLDVCDPRRRVSGTGVPSYEIGALLPRVPHGLPSRVVEVDSSDPPTYESEAAYLERHRLFQSGERRRVRASAWEPVAIVDDDTDDDTDTAREHAQKGRTDP